MISPMFLRQKHASSVLFFPKDLSPVHLTQKYFYVNPIIFSFVSEVGSHQGGASNTYNSLAKVFEYLVL